jgi:N4-gp56 family major capsid protein
MMFRRYSNFSDATTALTEGVTPTSTSLSKTDVNATIALYGAYSEHTDMLADTQPEAVLQENIDILSQQMGETFDSLYFTNWGTATNTTFANGSATTAVNTLVTYADFSIALRELRNRKAKTFVPMMMAGTREDTGPVMPAYWCLITEDMLYDVRAFTTGSNQGTKFLLAAEYANSSGVLPGEAGALRDGIRFLVTPDGLVALGGGETGSQVTGGVQETSDAADVHSAFLVGKDAAGGISLDVNNGGIIQHNVGSAGTADPLNQRSTVGWKKYDARLILNQDFFQEIQGAVSA